MVRLAIRMLALAAALPGCGPTGHRSTCVETLPETPRCCEPSLYQLTPIPELLSDPGAHFGHYVETVGIADWYTSNDPGSGCICPDPTACSCPTELGLRSAKCGSMVRIGGTYGGRPVECSDLGCFPLNVLGNYAVCATWAPSETLGEPGMLQLAPSQGFCLR